MADITLNTFADGSVADSTQVEANFYTPTATGTTSLEAINGHLDQTNMESGKWEIESVHLQRRSMSGGFSRGGNINLDFFGETFNGWTLAEDAATPAEADKYYLPIPGGSTSFHLPYAASLVVFSWSLFLSAFQDKGNELDNLFQMTGARVRLFIDGVRTIKEFPVPTGGLNNSVGVAGNWGRGGCGSHLATGLTKGWHNVSLRIVLPPQTGGVTPVLKPHNQTRVRARHMDYVYFR